jgi:hypothetical protein
LEDVGHAGYRPVAEPQDTCNDFSKD